MTQTIDAVLVPTDGSDGALAGARRGVALAARVDAALHALSVVDSPEIEPTLSSLDSGDRTDRETHIEEQAQRAVESVTAMARPHVSSVTTAIEWGSPVESITDYVDRHGIDLIAMGTHGRTGLERFLLGSVAEKTLRTATVPVLTVPPAAAALNVGAVTYEDVLVPTDGSEGAAVAAEWGLTLAGVYDATVHTIYSVDTSRFQAGTDTTDLHDDLERTGREALATIRERAGEAGLTVTGHLGAGPAARVILSYAEEHDVDLIVMGTHGRSGIERALIGSVTEKVVRHADVPVCSVPMPDA